MTHSYRHSTAQHSTVRSATFGRMASWRQGSWINRRGSWLFMAVAPIRLRRSRKGGDTTKMLARGICIDEKGSWGQGVYGRSTSLGLLYTYIGSRRLQAVAAGWPEAPDSSSEPPPPPRPRHDLAIPLGTVLYWRYCIIVSIIQPAKALFSARMGASERPYMARNGHGTYGT
ncbi:hypothetical protein DM02DRAFT_633860 [Periconia macrospinosa]|uniref:Uncharacterized protein n=1 Tax=Periconia macrospinosa TaxID=97972 RepID=A0A2V1D875_9PLEO|nr:hypothetical protein DM02DRAFT_633860 [Periconia macrospinosa]